MRRKSSTILKNIINLIFLFAPFHTGAMNCKSVLHPPRVDKGNNIENFPENLGLVSCFFLQITFIVLVLCYCWCTKQQFRGGCLRVKYYLLSDNGLFLNKRRLNKFEDIVYIKKQGRYSRFQKCNKVRTRFLEYSEMLKTKIMFKIRGK